MVGAQPREMTLALGVGAITFIVGTLLLFVFRPRAAQSHKQAIEDLHGSAHWANAADIAAAGVVGAGRRGVHRRLARTGP